MIASVMIIAIKPCGNQIYLFLYRKSHLIVIHTAKNDLPIIGMVQAVGQVSDLYKSDWKLQGNTNTQLKLLCRASYTGKRGGIDIIYLHDLPLSRFCNTQRNFSNINQNF